MNDRRHLEHNMNSVLYMQDTQANVLNVSQQYHPYTSYTLTNPAINTLNQGANEITGTLQLQQQRNLSVFPNQHLFSNEATSLDQTECPTWVVSEARHATDIERGLKTIDKMEMIEISSKDLSPASCCSNTDILLPDFYKNLGKDIGYFSKLSDSQWCPSNYNNQKYSDYPSCAQVSKNAQVDDKTVKYCSIKRNDIDNNQTNKVYPYSTCTPGDNLLYSKLFSTNKHYCQEPFIDPFVYDNKQQNMDTTQQLYQSTSFCIDNTQYDSFQNIEECTEASNGESDIIVEESEENITDYSEGREKKLNYSTNCAVCNAAYNSLENQFYFLTKESLLTVSSKKSVYAKLKDILGIVNQKHSFICSQCLSLINTIDYLQLKLENCKQEIWQKYEKTCKENDILLYDNHFNKIQSKIGKKRTCQGCRFKCKVCKKSYSLKNVYNCHMKRHKVKTKFLCEACGRRFANIQKFKFHLKKHTDNNYKQMAIPFSTFMCNLCRKHFRTRSNLKEHVNYCSGNMPYHCTYSNCDKSFPSSTKLKNHVKLKHDKKFSAICSICNIGFVKASNYKYHMVTHSTEKKFNCSKCDKSYKTLSNLNFHLKYHGKKLPFICKICQKGFMRKEYLEAHINVHNGVKNFVCQICDKRFVSQKNLDAHMKYHDGTVKKKNCNICGRMLTTGFEEHLRTHTNLKEFQCDICDLRFNTKGALSKHKKNKH